MLAIKLHAVHQNNQGAAYRQQAGSYEGSLFCNALAAKPSSLASIL